MVHRERGVYRESGGINGVKESGVINSIQGE